MEYVYLGKKVQCVVETCNTSQLDEALKLQREGEALTRENKLDEGLARFHELLVLLGKGCPDDRRARAEMWIGWIAHVRGEKRAAQLMLRRAAKLLGPYKEHYPREWIWLCSMNTRVEGRRASEAAVDALRGLIRKTVANFADATPLWDRADFSDELTKRWLADQDELAALWLRNLTGRQALRRRASKLYFGEIGNFHCARNALYYATSAQGTVHPTVMRLTGWNRIPQSILQPKDYGDNVHFAGFSVAPGERYVGFALAAGGADRVTIHLKDLKRNRILKDAISGLHFFRMAWHDETSFYYVRDNQVLLHQVGSRTKHDTVVFTAPEGLYITPWVASNRWLFVTGYSHAEHSVTHFYRPLNGTRWKTLKNVGGKDARCVWFKDKEMYLRSFAESNLGKLVACHVTKGRTRTVLRPSAGYQLQNVCALGKDQITLLVSKRMQSAIHLYTRGKRTKQLLLPPLTVAHQVGRANGSSVLVRMESPILPPTIYEMCPKTFTKQLRFESGVDFKQDDYEQSLHWATSFDGVKVPICIISRKGIPLSSSPIKMLVYGGFRIAQIPHAWDHYNAALLQMGCSLAFLGARGGDELGHKWYQAALHGRKILPVRDTVAGAQYLHSLGIPVSRIGLEGGSNGGLIAAAALAMAPSAFGCAVITNPVIDVSTCTERYEAEYGNPVQHKRRILQYSPLALLKPASYPAVLVKVHANDDRVPPSNGFRFVAKLQAMQQGDAPILLRLYQGAGHTGWTSGSTAFEDADLFFLHHFGLPAR